MDYQAFSAIFEENFSQNGLQDYLTLEITEKFYALTNIMTEVNQVMNLTAIREVDKIIPLHYADCVKIAHLFPQNATVIDIGCGGGFPTLPLAIVRPDLQITGIDSTAKKVAYVANTARALGLNNVKTLSARAEELAQDPEYREKFDCATSRAVARFNVLSELCLPFVKIGGKMIIMKGASGQEELDEGLEGVRKLGGEVESLAKDTLITPAEQEMRFNLTFSKTLATPTQYPRAFGQIKKKPL